MNTKTGVRSRVRFRRDLRRIRLEELDAADADQDDDDLGRMSPEEVRRQRQAMRALGKDASGRKLIVEDRTSAALAPSGPSQVSPQVFATAQAMVEDGDLGNFEQASA